MTWPQENIDLCHEFGWANFLRSPSWKYYYFFETYPEFLDFELYLILEELILWIRVISREKVPLKSAYTVSCCRKEQERSFVYFSLIYYCLFRYYFGNKILFCIIINFSLRTKLWDILVTCNNIIFFFCFFGVSD